MIVPDSSVLVAGAEPAHPHFENAADELPAVRSDGFLLAHTMAECFAVLTSSAFQRPAQHVQGYLEQFTSRPPIWLTGAAYAAAIAELTGLGIVGGQVWDGLIAIAARDAGATLVSLDQRAARTYERCGVDYRLLGD